jgi:hypothetical protein
MARLRKFTKSLNGQAQEFYLHWQAKRGYRGGEGFFIKMPTELESTAEGMGLHRPFFMTDTEKASMESLEAFIKGLEGASTQEEKMLFVEFDLVSKRLKSLSWRETSDTAKVEMNYRVVFKRTLGKSVSFFTKAEDGSLSMDRAATRAAGRSRDSRDRSTQLISWSKEREEALKYEYKSIEELAIRVKDNLKELANG